MREPLPLTFRVAGRRLEGETLHLDAGASVLVLTSCSAELCSRTLADGERGFAEQRRRLLYDHLHSLQDLALRAGVTLGFEGVEEAVGALDPRCTI